MTYPVIPIAPQGTTRQRKREAPKGRRVDRQALAQVQLLLAQVQLLLGQAGRSSDLLISSRREIIVIYSEQQGMRCKAPAATQREHC